MLEVLEDRLAPAVWTVNGLGDAGNGNLNPNGGGTGDLRYCILKAAAGDTITLQGLKKGTITTGSALTIAQNLTIVGPGAGILQVARSNAPNTAQFSVFIINSCTVNMSELEISNGSATTGGDVDTNQNPSLTLTNCVVDTGTSTGAGGGIWSTGSLTLNNTKVLNNKAGSAGGGIYAFNGTVLVTNGSMLAGNTANTSGGALFNSGDAPVSIINSSIVNNTASSNDGGGIDNEAGTPPQGVVAPTNLTLKNVTFTGNQAKNGLGGAIYTVGQMQWDDCTLSKNTSMKGAAVDFAAGAPPAKGNNNLTIAFNTATTTDGSASAGGGIYLDAGETIALVNSIVADNTADSGPDVSGAVSSTGYNLIGDGDGSSGWLASDLVGTSSTPIDPLLDDLSDNGGPTQTMLLEADSPALGAGDPTQVASATDQRGFARIVNGSVDIGAVEMQTAAVGTTVSLSSSLNPSLNGQAVTFSVLVTAANGGTPTGTVTFYDDSGALDTETLDSSGGAQFTTSALTVGNHPIKALYSGDGTFAGNTAAVLTQEVDDATTTISLGSSLNPAYNGQSVTFDTFVTPSSWGSPTGTVTFYDGSTVLGTVALYSGEAQFTTAALTVGTHNITAEYSGDAIFSGSTSAVFAQEVDPATTTISLNSDGSPSTYGQTVNFTAFVTPAYWGSPSGTVSFYDGSTLLGTVALYYGEAHFATSTLAVGPHGITAVYSGDSIFTGSTSDVFTQQVTS